MKSYLFTSYEDEEAQLLYEFIRNGHIGQDSEKTAKAIEVFTATCPDDHQVYKIEFSMIKNTDLLEGTEEE